MRDADLQVSNYCLAASLALNKLSCQFLVDVTGGRRRWDAGHVCQRQRPPAAGVGERDRLGGGNGSGGVGVNGRQVVDIDISPKEVVAPVCTR